jgi:hypothetical protein
MRPVDGQEFSRLLAEPLPPLRRGAGGRQLKAAIGRPEHGGHLSQGLRGITL